MSTPLIVFGLILIGVFGLLAWLVFRLWRITRRADAIAAHTVDLAGEVEATLAELRPALADLQQVQNQLVRLRPDTQEQFERIRTGRGFIRDH